MSIYNCVLCFKEMDKDYERFLVKSKKKTIVDVSVAHGNLDFYIHAVSGYICIVKWDFCSKMLCFFYDYSSLYPFFSIVAS